MSQYPSPPSSPSLSHSFLVPLRPNVQHKMERLPPPTEEKLGKQQTIESIVAPRTGRLRESEPTDLPSPLQPISQSGRMSRPVPSSFRSEGRKKGCCGGGGEKAQGRDGKWPKDLTLDDVKDIFTAVKLGLLDQVQKFLEGHDHVVDIDSVDEDGNTVMHWACFYKHSRIIDYLLSKGCDLSIANYTEKQTALHWAVMAGARASVGKLLNHGADGFQVDKRGYNCLHTSSQYQQSLLAVFFLNKGIPVDSLDNEGHTPLHWAAYVNNTDLIELYLSWKADINKTDVKGMTPLHWAAIKGNFNAALTLLDHNAIPDLDDKQNRAPTDLAIEKDQRLIATIIGAHTLQRLSPSKAWMFRLILGFILPLLFFSLLVTLPIYLGPPIVFLIVSVLMRAMGAAYLSISGIYSNPSSVASSFSILLISIYVYIPYHDQYFEFAQTEGFIFLSTSMLYCLVWGYLIVSDPGFVGKKIQNQYHASVLLDKISEGNSLDKEIPDICSTCMLGKPIRSVHCTMCGRCVALHDHHDSWTNKCVGFSNLGVFSFSCLLGVVVHFLYLKFLLLGIDSVRSDESGIVMFFLDAYYEAPMLFFSLFLHFILFWGSVVQMFERYKCLVKGMTLSESQDPTSRPYLYSGGLGGGQMYNPFDKGSMCLNAFEFYRRSGIDYTSSFSQQLKP